MAPADLTRSLANSSPLPDTPRQFERLVRLSCAPRKVLIWKAGLLSGPAPSHRLPPKLFFSHPCFSAAPYKPPALQLPPGAVLTFDNFYKKFALTMPKVRSSVQLGRSYSEQILPFIAEQQVLAAKQRMQQKREARHAEELRRQAEERAMSPPTEQLESLELTSSRRESYREQDSYRAPTWEDEESGLDESHVLEGMDDSSGSDGRGKACSGGDCNVAEGSGAECCNDGENCRCGDSKASDHVQGCATPSAVRVRNAQRERARERKGARPATTSDVPIRRGT